MSQSASIDHASYAKRGFQVGVALFAIGALGELLGNLFIGPLPGWEQALLFDMEVLGVLVGLLAPLVFGIVLPLVE
jgi:hypothetical protein